MVNVRANFHGDMLRINMKTWTTFKLREIQGGMSRQLLWEQNYYFFYLRQIDIKYTKSKFHLRTLVVKKSLDTIANFKLYQDFGQPSKSKQ